MKLRQIFNRRATELSLNGDTLVLFSYSTPVAAWLSGKVVKTEVFYSVTTSRHINDWLRQLGVEQQDVESVDQSVLDNLVK